VKVGDGQGTAALSRDHTIHIDPRSGLTTIAGGKWTTYRRMAEDLVDHVSTLAGLEPRPCVTTTLNLHGWSMHAARDGEFAVYGSDAPAVAALAASDPALAARIHPRLPATHAEIAWAARNEMARTIDDALARRTRSLLFDSRAAVEAAPGVAATMANELGLDARWQRAQVEAFAKIAHGYLPPGDA
jgi:glycerol-3-phosphate dehydrogenase